MSGDGFLYLFLVKKDDDVMTMGDMEEPEVTKVQPKVENSRPR